MKIVAILVLAMSMLFALVDINNATADELLELNGIGKAKSQKIIEYREVNHCFKSITDLAKIDGISKKIITTNRDEIILGKCALLDVNASGKSSLTDVLFDPVNIFFVIIIFILGVLDYTTGKDLKSQIVSIGVLGTFVGIFIGLQAFNPDDITNSVNDILVGLKTAFFTSIVGMSVSTGLAITEKFQREKKDE